MDKEILQEAEAMIRSQQGDRGPKWMCGEQLLEIIGRDVQRAKLALDDLQHGGMSLAACEMQIRKFAQKNDGCCTGPEADKIIRAYFGLPGQAEEKKPKDAQAADTIRMEDFF